MDAMLMESLEAGARQFVNLGAGLDSRAYRFQDRLKGLKTFELDFPATQEHKKKRVREVLGALPAHVIFVPIDFTKDDLGTALKRAGYQPTLKTFFLWEGVTMYLTEEAIKATLRFMMQNSAPGSVIAFDYFTRSDLPARRSAQRADTEEPFLFGFPDGRTSVYLAEQGLRVMHDLNPDQIAARFLTRADGSVIRNPASAWYCAAVVPEKRQ
jgi:methyltransferase (TIGR00027 family)